MTGETDDKGYIARVSTYLKDYFHGVAERSKTAPAKTEAFMGTFAAALGGGEEGKHNAKLMAHELLQGHVLNAVKYNTKLTGNIITNAPGEYVNWAGEQSVAAAGRAGVPEAAAQQAMAIEVAKHGHLLDAANHAMQADRAIFEHVIGHDQPLATPKGAIPAPGAAKGK